VQPNGTSGQFWIRTAEKSGLLLNTVKKNGIYVQPFAVYEYTTGSGWVERDAEVYHDGAWAELNTFIYLYNKGNSTGYSFACDENMKQRASGYTAEAERVAVGSSSITVTTSATRAYDFTNIFTTDTYGAFTKVDLSEWTKVRIKGTLSGATRNTECVFRVMSAMGTVCTENNVAAQSFTAGVIDATIDVSAIDSSCYLGFTFYNDTTTPVAITFELTELWLE